MNSNGKYRYQLNNHDTRWSVLQPSTNGGNSRMAITQFVGEEHQISLHICQEEKGRVWVGGGAREYHFLPGVRV